MVLYPNKLPESERVCSGICILTVRIKRENTEKLQEKWHMEDYVISSSYAIIYFKDIY